MLVGGQEGLECEEGSGYGEGCDGREEWLPPDQI